MEDMKIRAIANGDVIEAEADAASELIASGIYEVHDEKTEEERAPVSPLTTEDLPPQPTPVKPEPVKAPKKKKKSGSGKYKRRDMQAEVP